MDRRKFLAGLSLAVPATAIGAAQPGELIVHEGKVIGRWEQVLTDNAPNPPWVHGELVKTVGIAVIDKEHAREVYSYHSQWNGFTCVRPRYKVHGRVLLTITSYGNLNEGVKYLVLDPIEGTITELVG